MKRKGYAITWMLSLQLRSFVIRFAWAAGDLGRGWRNIGHLYLYKGDLTK